AAAARAAGHRSAAFRHRAHRGDGDRVPDPADRPQPLRAVVDLARADVGGGQGHVALRHPDVHLPHDRHIHSGDFALAAKHDLRLGADRVPAADWDPVGPEAIADPHAVHADLRGRCPVAYSDRWGGFYTLTRYEDVVRASRDSETFTATRQTVIPAS